MMGRSHGQKELLMKAPNLSRVRPGVLLLVALAVVTPPALAEGPAPAPAKGMAAALQPFVDRHALAGAVTLVSDKDKVLSVEAVGFADVAARKPLRPDA